MNEELKTLLEQARQNQAERWQQLLDAVRQASADNPGLLVELAQADDELQRRTAIAVAAIDYRVEPVIVEAMFQLTYDPLLNVRQSLVYALQDYPTWGLNQVAEILLEDADSGIRQSALWACKSRFLWEALIRRLGGDDSNYVRQDIATALADAPPEQALPPLLKRLAEDSDFYVQQSAATSGERLLAGLGGDYPASYPQPAMSGLAEMRRRVTAIGVASYPKLSSWLDRMLGAFVDVNTLTRFGNVLTQEARAGQLPRGHGLDKHVDAVLSILEGSPPRAAVLIGESGSGKTAVVNELVHRLAHEGPGGAIVLRMSPQDFLVDTKWIGEWETKVRDLVNAVKYPKRVILYVPNIEQLAWVGTTSSSQSNVAAALQPAIERGDLVILGESSVEGFRKGLGANRSMRRLFTSVEMQPATSEEARHVLGEVAREAKADISAPTLDRLHELADYFVSGSVQPGRSVGLLRLVLGLRGDRPGPLTEKDVLETISTSTGMPLTLLSDSVALDRAGVRGFFESRVMGQTEAVDAVVDLVTLVKAGLTDPGKPFGVFLFVGPTGVGKTEMARALAEHLFGDPARMIRLDMSEFANYESYERLIGHAYANAEPGLLTSKVREQPFAVVLLDEIEKAHVNVYNLCLQIFDAGRLTDGQGRTADFRRTIIIMTSNVGSVISTQPTMGILGETPPPPDRDTLLREIGHWFRPEFLNRIDRIVTFLPLAQETAEKICQREVHRVLERGGITRRGLEVDVDPSVIPLLLQEGYSRAFGARPLKRAIERLVLLPVARVIAEGKATPGSIMRLVARRNFVTVEVEQAETVETPATEEPARAQPTAERAETMLARVEDLSSRASPLAARKSEILALYASPGFWTDQDNGRALQDEIYRLDAILNALPDLRHKIQAEAEQARRSGVLDRDLVRIDQHLDGLEHQLGHLDFLVGCRDGKALGDALITLRLATRQGKGLDGVVLLARMYQHLAQRRGLEAQVLDDRLGPEPRADTITLLLSGPGAYALLCGESGLHQISRGRKQDKGTQERDMVAVAVLPVPGSAVQFGDEVKAEVKALHQRAGRLLAKLKFAVRLFHQPSNQSVSVWVDGSKSQAVEKARLLLAARLGAGPDGAAQPGGRAQVIRRYRLGPTTLVRDQRTGKSTGRLDDVLAGHIDPFLQPPATEEGSTAVAST